MRAAFDTLRSLILLPFILLSPNLTEQIPLAALVGVIFVVVKKTFEWDSLQSFCKIPRSDALIVVAAMVVTIFTDLAIAVLLGVVIAALVFAWPHTKRINVKTHIDNKGWEIYGLADSLFFASTAGLQTLFIPHGERWICWQSFSDFTVPALSAAK